MNNSVVFKIKNIKNKIQNIISFFKILQLMNSNLIIYQVQASVQQFLILEFKFEFGKKDQIFEFEFAALVSK